MHIAFHLHTLSRSLTLCAVLNTVPSSFLWCNVSHLSIYENNRLTLGFGPALFFQHTKKTNIHSITNLNPQRIYTLSQCDYTFVDVYAYSFQPAVCLVPSNTGVSRRGNGIEYNFWKYERPMSTSHSLMYCPIRCSLGFLIAPFALLCHDAWHFIHFHSLFGYAIHIHLRH